METSLPSRSRRPARRRSSIVSSSGFKWRVRGFAGTGVKKTQHILMNF
jgi:hypothetical protein